MKKASISLHNIDKSYGHGNEKTQVIFDLSVDIFPSELTLLVGPSGCGKTTLISIMSGILNTDHGILDVLNHPLHQLPDADKTIFRRNHLGFIFQSFNLIPTLNVTENVAVPLLVRGIPRKQAFHQAQEVIHKVGLTPRAHYLPFNLSGGEKQRVAIARAIVHNPQFIVCDEPTSSLDTHNGQIVMQLLKDIALCNNRTVIIVTHDDRVFNYGDRIIEMEDGRIKKISEIHKESAS